MVYYYGASVLSLPQHVINGLYGAIPSLQAMLELEARHMNSELSSTRLHDMIYLTTLDIDLAERYQAQFILDSTKGGKTPVI